MKWIIGGFLFVGFLIIFVSAWFPEWPVKWGNARFPGNGYPASAAGKIVGGAFEMLLALCIAIDGFQPKYLRYVEFGFLLLLFAIATFFCFRDKAKFDRKNSQN